MQTITDMCGGCFLFVEADPNGEPGYCPRCANKAFGRKMHRLTEEALRGITIDKIDSLIAFWRDFDLSTRPDFKPEFRDAILDGLQRLLSLKRS
jgi:hypothetical protein